MPRTETGYRAETAGEWTQKARRSFENIAVSLGLSPPRWVIAEFVNAVAVVVGQIAGEIDSGVEGVVRMFDPRQIAGDLLIDLGRLAGVPLVRATNSTVSLTLGAWTVAPVGLTSGAVVASDGTNRWVLAEDVTIPAGSTIAASFECETAGHVTAAIGTITQRVTSVNGWTSVTNAAAATPGRAATSDAALRSAIGRGGGSFGSRSEAAIRTALRAVPDVQDAQVFFNNTLAAVTKAGRSVPGNGVAIWIYPDTIPTTSKTQLLTRLYAMLDGSCARSLPLGTGSTGVLGEVPGADGRRHREGFWWYSAVTVYVTVELDFTEGYEAGYTVGDLDEPIRAAVENYFAGLQRNTGGSTFIRHDDIVAACRIPGCARAVIKLGLSASPADPYDLTIDPGNFPVLDLDILHTGESV